MSQPRFVMSDCTEEILNTPGDFDSFHCMEEETYEVEDLLITTDMINRKPYLKKAVLEALGQKESEVKDEDLTDLLNYDPTVRTTLAELFCDVAQCEHNEGEPTYYPSIVDYDSLHEIQEILEVSGFREDKIDAELPHKYAHLSKESVELIYSNPNLRIIVSRMKGRLTDELIQSMVTHKN